MSRWAREQIRPGPETMDQRRQLAQLIEAADALSAELPPAREPPANVIALDAFRRRAS